MIGNKLIPNNRRADISFRQNGRIDISARVAKSVGIKKGDVINIKKINGEFYLYVAVPSDQCCGNYSARCTQPNAASKNLRVWCSEICKSILSLFPENTAIARIPAGEVKNIDGTNHIALITHINLA